MPSKKDKASSGNIGLKIDGELSFDKLKVAEKNIVYYSSWRSFRRVLTSWKELCGKLLSQQRCSSK